MSKTYFSDDHEYVKVDGGTATVGISDYAQKALGDVVYVELPKVGQKLEKGAQAGVVESVKSASEIYAPVSGEVTEINTKLSDDSSLVNSDPMGAAWFFKMKLSDESQLSALKDEGAYNEFIKGI